MLEKNCGDIKCHASLRHVQYEFVVHYNKVAFVKYPRWIPK